MGLTELADLRTLSSLSLRSKELPLYGVEGLFRPRTASSCSAANLSNGLTYLLEREMPPPLLGCPPLKNRDVLVPRTLSGEAIDARTPWLIVESSPEPEEECLWVEGVRSVASDRLFRPSSRD
jgi:hypothetical protein